MASALYRVWEGDAAQYLDGISYAASSAPAAPVASILLDAFDNAGETPKHLLSENFLRSCHDALAPGGVIVCNFFNGPVGSARRAALARCVRLFTQCVGPSYTMCVPGQEESVVLVARRPLVGGDPARPGMRELMDGAQRAWAAAPGLRPREARRLTRNSFWAEALPRADDGDATSTLTDADATLILRELKPPPTTAGVAASSFGALQDKLDEGSSACAAWMMYEEEEEEEEEDR